MIRINNLQKNFGTKKAVDIENYTIGQGDMLGLVGNNGAGKTTLFRLILDLLQADRGNVTINDIDVSKSEDWKNFTGALYRRRFPDRLPHSRRILLFHRQDVRSEERGGRRTPASLRTLHERRSDGAEKIHPQLFCRKQAENRHHLRYATSPATVDSG